MEAVTDFSVHNKTSPYIKGFPKRLRGTSGRLVRVRREARSAVGFRCYLMTSCGALGLVEASVLLRPSKTLCLLVEKILGQRERSVRGD